MKPRTSAKPTKLGVGDGACELRHIVSDRQHKAPGALSEDQIDQHDRENADEPELDELPQKLFRKGHVAMNLAWRNLLMTHTTNGWGASLPTPIASAIQSRLNVRLVQAIFLFENSQRTIPSVIRPTRPLPPMSSPSP